MKSVSDTAQFPPCPHPFNLAAHVLASANHDPNKVALSVVSETTTQNMTYSDLRQSILGCARGFQNAGLNSGDHLLMRVGNVVEFPVAYLAAIAVGIIPVPTSSQLTSSEVQVLMNVTRPAAVLHDGLTACPDHPTILRTDQMKGWYGLPAAEFEFGDPDRLAYIIFTSGTSGMPRAVCHAHRAIWARGMMMDGWYGLTKTDRLMHAGAFNWTYTLGTGLLDPWTKGATALIPAQDVSHDQIPELIKKNDVSIFAAAPGVYRNILKQGKIDAPMLRHGLSAGEKLSDKTKDAWQIATRTEIYEAFGMSECSTFISTAPGSVSDRSGSLGWPQPGRQVSILGENGPVDVGETGIIAIHQSDPGLMLGYLDNPQETEARFQKGWFLTGDTGEMTPHGEIVYHGRADDMMNAGGYRVSPLEVEAALSAHPDIQDVGVTEYEVKAETWVISAFYISGTTINVAELEQWASTRLARYKQPRLYKRVAAMPRNANGKLVRRDLRKS